MFRHFPERKALSQHLIDASTLSCRSHELVQNLDYPAHCYLVKLEVFISKYGKCEEFDCSWLPLGQRPEELTISFSVPSNWFVKQFHFVSSRIVKPRI